MLVEWQCWEPDQVGLWSVGHGSCSWYTWRCYGWDCWEWQDYVQQRLHHEYLSEFQEKIYPFDEYLTYKNKTKACASHKYKVEDTVLFIESDNKCSKKKLPSPSKGPYKSFSFTPMGPFTFNVECATKLSSFITYAQTIHATKITKCTWCGTRWKN